MDHIMELEHAVPSCAEKEGTQISHKSQWKTFGKVLQIFCGLQMILQFEESRSAVAQILQFEERTQKIVMVLRSWISLAWTIKRPIMRPSVARVIKRQSQDLGALVLHGFAHALRHMNAQQTWLQ